MVLHYQPALQGTTQRRKLEGGELIWMPPCWRLGILLENASMIYVFITHFYVFDANTFLDNLFILTKKNNIPGGSVMAGFYGEIFHQVEQL